MFSKKATRIDEMFTVDLTVTTYCQIDSEGFVCFSLDTIGSVKKFMKIQDLQRQFDSM